MNAFKPISTLISAGLIAGLISTQAFAVNSNPPLEPRESTMGVSKPRIVGGGPTTDNSSRWITSLQSGGQHFCGGALIDPSWVLTAAHCVQSESAADDQFSVWVGGVDLTVAQQGQRRDVTEIIVHESYNDGTLVNDIALLRLASPVNIATVQLATAAVMSGPAAPNQPVTVSGWGALTEGGDIPDVLHDVSIPVVSNATCNAPESYAGEITSSHICAGLREGGRDSCQGDSGGPLWVRSNGQDYHVGVVSFGDGCARPNKYGVYTRTNSYQDWVAARLAGQPAPAGGQGGNQPGDQPGNGGGGFDGGFGGDGFDNGGFGDGGFGTGDNFDTGGCQPLSGDTSVTNGVNTGGNAASITQLNSGDQEFGLQGSIDDRILFAIEVPADTVMLTVDISGGNGDADLYVAQGRVPSLQDYDFAPFIDGNNENVSVEAPAAGTWYIMIHGFDSFDNVSLNVFAL